MIGKELSFGRKNIYTDKEINIVTLPEIITEAMQTHIQNAKEIDRLIDIYIGKHDILDRKMNQYTTVNNKIVLNYPEKIMRDRIEYTFGKPAQYTQKKTEFREDIQKLSDILEYENCNLTDIENEKMVGIGGIGYQITLPKGEYDSTPEIPIKIDMLDPRQTFCVKSSKVGNPVVLTCTYYDTNDGKNNYRYYNIYTDTERYEYKVKGKSTIIKTEDLIDNYKHLMGGNPITVYENNQFLTGDFEKEVTIINAIDKLSSDSINDIEKYVQSILLLVNVELGEDTPKKIRENGTLEVKTVEGAEAEVKYLYSNISVENIKQAKEMLIDALYSNTGTPRESQVTSGGDTGIATEYKDGWVELELVAKGKERQFKKSKRMQLRIILNLLKRKKIINENLSVIDIKIDLPRNKNDNIQTKTQAYSVLHATQSLDPVDSLEFVNLTTDVNEVIKRGEKYWANKTETEVVADEE